MLQELYNPQLGTGTGRTGPLYEQTTGPTEGYPSVGKMLKKPN